MHELTQKQNNNITGSPRANHYYLMVGLASIFSVLIFVPARALERLVIVLRPWLRELFHLVMHSCSSELAVL